MNKNYNRVDSLTSKCIYQIVCNLEMYFSDLMYLPNHLKNQILRHTYRFAKKPQTFLHKYFTSLLNSQTESLDLSTIICDKQIIDKLKICSALKVLIFGEVQCEAEEFASLFLCFPNLNKLHTTVNHYITDTIIDVITRNCPKLYALDIKGSINVTDETLNCIVRNDSNLIAIDLSSSKITNEGIENLIAHKGALIEDLRLQNCNQITNEAILAVMKNCPNIKLLLYHNCLNIETENLEIEPNNLRLLTWTLPWR